MGSQVSPGVCHLEFFLSAEFFWCLFCNRGSGSDGKGLHFTSAILRKEVGQQEQKQSSPVKEHLLQLQRWGEKGAFSLL